MRIRFVSRNTFKIREVQSILSGADVEVVPVEYSIDEIQTEDVERLVKDKLLKAFKTIGCPVFVEPSKALEEFLRNFV